MLSKGAIFTRAAAAPAAKVFACAALAAILILLLIVPTARAQFASPGELPAIDAATWAAIVDSITAAIDSIYVLEEPAERIVAGEVLIEDLGNGVVAADGLSESELAELEANGFQIQVGS